MIPYIIYFSYKYLIVFVFVKKVCIFVKNIIPYEEATLNTKEWINQRINYALELRDLNVELETISALIKEYFD